MAFFRLSRLSALLAVSFGLAGCSLAPSQDKDETSHQGELAQSNKAVVYQMFTRLFGNTQTANIPWGTAEQNGVGKFNDISDKALEGIKELGVSHVWYTGVPHHALVADYTAYGISNDDPDVIKGRAGSPYAVKDYYSVNPDLAQDPAKRMDEFKALVERSHEHGLKVLIDIVPNHVARNYESLGKPQGVKDFGAADNTNVEYARDNNFYYAVGEAFKVPEWLDGYQPLGGQPYPMADGEFVENPAKWTGNGARSSQPHFHDWYETVKVNYGVRPDGSHDFPQLPAEYANMDVAAHYEFWQGKDVPDSWEKFRDIALFWTEFGIDGFRYDMAEMVPVAFWSYLNSHIKHVNPDAFLLAEVYQPHLYRDYLHMGKMDYLYDKVDLYDSLKAIIQGRESTDAIASIQAGKADIEHNMLHFLENHDEQRIASPDFAGEAVNALPAMVVSATLSSSPTMLYFGQDVGERGEQDAGFGKATRTTIFDYWGVPAHQRWMNNGKFDGGALTADERQLRDYYVRLMQFVQSSPALMGQYAEIHTANKHNPGYTGSTYAFLRWSDDQQLIIASNFAQVAGTEFALKIPAQQISAMKLKDGRYTLVDQLSGDKLTLTVASGKGQVDMALAPLQSRILELKR